MYRRLRRQGAEEMADADAKPNEKLAPQSLLFAVRGYNLKVIRELSASSASGFAGHGTNHLNFATSVHGVAVARKDMVCVHGTNRHSHEFALTVRSDARAVEEWQACLHVSETRAEHDRGESVSEDKAERLEGRVKEIQNREFERSPPTAHLYGPGAFYGGRIGEWRIDVMIPSPVLEQLVTDVSDHRVVTISIDIRWVAAFSTGYDFGSATIGKLFYSWCLIGGSEQRKPEPLSGQVQRFEWALAAESDGAQRPVSEVLFEQTDAWSEALSLSRAAHKEDRARLLASAIVAGNSRITEDECTLSGRFDMFVDFIRSTDEALHAGDHPLDKDYGLWHHRSFEDVITVAANRSFIGSELLGELVTEYLAAPWLNHPYLDWLFLDSMLFMQLSDTVRDFATLKHGLAFALAGGIGWKMTVWKVVLNLLRLLSWVAPAAICYLIARWSFWAAIGLGAAWYGLALLGFGFWLAGKLAQLVSSEPSPLRRMAQAFEEMTAAYASLAGPVLHLDTIRTALERAANRACTLDHRIFVLLDRARQHGSGLWTTWPQHTPRRAEPASQSPLTTPDQITPDLGEPDPGLWSASTARSGAIWPAVAKGVGDVAGQEGSDYPGVPPEVRKVSEEAGLARPQEVRKSLPRWLNWVTRIGS